MICDFEVRPELPIESSHVSQPPVVIEAKEHVRAGENSWQVVYHVGEPIQQTAVLCRNARSVAAHGYLGTKVAEHLSKHGQRSR